MLHVAKPSTWVVAFLQGDEEIVRELIKAGCRLFDPEDEEQPVMRACYFNAKQARRAGPCPPLTLLSTPRTALQPGESCGVFICSETMIGGVDKRQRRRSSGNSSGPWTCGTRTTWMWWRQPPAWRSTRRDGSCHEARQIAPFNPPAHQPVVRTCLPRRRACAFGAHALCVLAAATVLSVICRGTLWRGRSPSRHSRGKLRITKGSCCECIRQIKDGAQSLCHSEHTVRSPR